MASKALHKDFPELKDFVLSNVHKTGTNLGRGAFGVVEELAVGRTLCAGKKLHAVLLDAHNEGIQRTLKRFIAECKLMSKLRHPRIVQFMGLCFFDDSPYPMLVMEKLDVDLQTLLETQNNVPFVAVLHILKDIAEGLVHMHGQSPPVIHRDLTARNVLIIQGSLRAKIGDLGNALCMTDFTTVTNSLSRIPGTLLYMPPEALEYGKKYDSMLDMFSFGHLALFAMIQEFPRELLPPTFYDEKGVLRARNEAGRREKYVEKLVAKLTKDHVVTKMIIQCLHNTPERRLTATKAMEQISNVCKEEDHGAYEQMKYPPDLLHKTAIDRRKSALLESVRLDPDQYLKQRTEEFRNGVPGLLDIYRSYGRLPRKEGWKRQAFQIKDGVLQYSKQDMRDRPYDTLELSSVVQVKAIQPREDWNESRFYFEVHYSGARGSPWLLRTYTQDDRTCWMEAIHPTLASPIEEYHQYEVVTLPEREVYSYVQVPGYHHQGVKGLQVFYEGASSRAPAVPLPQQRQQIQKSPVLARKATKKPTKSQKAAIQVVHEEQLQETKDSYYDDIIPMPSTDMYEVMHSRLPLSPQRSITVPQELSAMSELSIDDISELSQSKAQLWLLNQMQKLVQKIEGIHGPSETTKEGKRPSLDEAKGHQGDSGLQMLIDQRPNLMHTKSTEDHKSVGAQGPPVPPRDHGHQYLQQSRAMYGDKTNLAIPKSPVHQAAVHPDLPGTRLKPQSSVTGRTAVTLPKQKRGISHEEMISSLRARNKSISLGIESHLVIDDDDSESKARPEWTKAKIRSPQIEPSLADLKQKALFLSRSALSENLEEIGQGKFGKVYKGIHKGSGLPVAIKTIKQYQSEKERESFQKEMTVMSKLIHPNIVRLFGLVQQESPLIVLEYLPHGDLKNFLTSYKQPVVKLFKYMLDVATGMHYISEKGLVHRDLAARNIMVGEDEICKVGDFGLLRELPKDVAVYVARTKVAFPTRWMAPESHWKKEFSPASDVWSFGVVMWEMYNPTELPYKELSNPEVAANVCMGTRLDIPNAYPPTVVSIMKACWQRDSSKRPSFLLIAMLLTNVVFGTD